MKNSDFEYQQKAAQLNTKYPSLKAEVLTSAFGGRLEIEVSTPEKAKILREMNPSFAFTSGNYK